MMQQCSITMLAVTVLGISIFTGCSKQPVSKGREFYIGSGCARCHGQSLEGTNLGPSLRRVRTGWTSDRLAAYFEDPNKFISTDPRLREYKKKFRTSMPSYGALDESTRLELARYLIGEEE